MLMQGRARHHPRGDPGPRRASKDSASGSAAPSGMKSPDIPPSSVPQCTSTGTQSGVRPRGPRHPWDDRDERPLGIRSPNYQQSSLFAPFEKLVLELAVAMCRTPVEIPDRLRDDLLEHLTPAQFTKVAATIAWENHRARLNRVLGARAVGFSDGAFCGLPTACRADPLYSRWPWLSYRAQLTKPRQQHRAWVDSTSSPWLSHSGKRAEFTSVRAG
jgi:hypothetical protein